MIEKMHKYAFLVFHRQYEDFLHKLKQVGVLHVKERPEGVAENDALRQKMQLAAQIDKLADEVAAILTPDMQALPAEGGCTERVFADYEAMKEELQRIRQLAEATEKEMERMAVWGKFDTTVLQRIASDGWVLQYFVCQKSRFNDDWKTEQHAVIVGETTSNYYFVTVNHSPVEIEAEPVVLNARNVEQLNSDMENIKGLEVAQIAKMQAWAVANLNNLRQWATDIREGMKFDTVLLNTLPQAANKLMLLEGYCPVAVEKALQDMLRQENIYYEVAEPEAEDNVPIKLRNNAFTRMFEPLTGMYGMPVYAEFDPTPILAPFFLLFFAMCMGDAGYGLLLILFGLGVKYDKIKMEMFSGLGGIITVLGVATIVIGFFLGTAFGVDLYTASFMPESLKAVMIKGEVAGFDYQMVLALAIGVFHIILALVVKAVCYTQREGAMKNLSTYGWLLLIVGGLVVTALSMLHYLSAEATKYALIAVGAVSALGIYIFNDPKRNPLINIGAGLWDTYNMATGILGDVLSYIRLYALGLAGGMLGGAFNNLGLMILGDQPGIVSWIGFVFILLLGHLLNLAMSALGAFVHPLRLTFVEYFKNAGYEGKGEKYAPFKTEK